MMDEREQLRSAVRQRTMSKSRGTVRLDDVVKRYMDNQVSPRQAKFELVARLWSQLLPSRLYRHCKIADMSGGRLKVLVDSPSYMHELRLCRSELLDQLQQQCPRARIRKIDFAPG